MKFKRTSENMEIKTKKGLLVIESSEYFQIDGERSKAPIVINKEGIQKIEDFFGASYVEPVINQIWNSGSNFNIVVTVGLMHEDKTYFGIGSANNLSLTNVIAQAYPAEMAIKRAKATAALDLLRTNYTGSDRLPLLYSTFDEFNAEDSINSKVDIVEDKAPVTKAPTTKATVKTEVKEEVKPDVKPDVKEEVKTAEAVPASTNTSNETAVEETPVENFKIVTSKYRNGITLQELYETNVRYYQWLSKTEVKGDYILYQEKVKEHMAKFNIKFA